MQIKDIKLHNILSFISGNFNYYLDKIKWYPEHKREQITYRLYQCKDDCVVIGKCKVCSCPTKKKVFAAKSCNNGERFPDMMNEKDWNEYKIQKGI